MIYNYITHVSSFDLNIIIQALHKVSTIEIAELNHERYLIPIEQTKTKLLKIISFVSYHNTYIIKSKISWNFSRRSSQRHDVEIREKTENILK